MRYLSYLVSLLLPVFAAFAQGPANTWYFGAGAGISFDTSPPTILTDGNLNTLEGCASISDEQGKLLFYTDGITVYNADHDIMEGGTDLYGDPSSTQSAIIIPKPLDPNIYYIFTVDVLRVNNSVISTRGINYSIVDFSVNPKGAITTVNAPLLAFSSEKLSAVIKGCDSESVWMVTQSNSSGQIPTGAPNFNTFYAFEITPNGINTSPVKSTVPIVSGDQRGNLKFSPNGKKLASANMSFGLFLMDFDSETGRVSNPEEIPINSPNDASYGVEFSQSNRFLYVHASNNQDINAPNSAHFSSLLQFDLESTDIPLSQVVLDEQNLYRGSLQLGPNGRIYRSLSLNYTVGLPYLGVIENPNEPGLASNYKDRAISLGSGISYQGLPPFNQSLFNVIDIINNDLSNTQLSLCEDESYTLNYENVPGADYVWYRNGNIIPGETGNQLTVSRPVGGTLPQTVTYELILDRNDGSCDKTGTAEITFHPYPSPPPAPVSLIQCEDATTADGFSLFNLNESIPALTNGSGGLTVSFYETEADADLERFPVNPVGYENKSPTQTLYARIQTPADCNITVPFEIVVSSTTAYSALLEACDEEDTGFMQFDLNEARQQLLAGQSPSIDISYYLSEDDALLENPDARLPELYRNEVAYDQTVFARLENNNECFAISQVELRVNIRPEFVLEEEAVYCENLFPENIFVSPEYNLDVNGDYSFMWMPGGQTTPDLETNQPGMHTLTVTDNTTGCFRTATVNILEKGLATIESIDVTDATDNNTAVINISGTGSFQFALDELGPFQESNRFEGLKPGFYTVLVRSEEGCGLIQQDFSVIGFPKYFTPNADGYNDLWQVKGISRLVQPRTTIRIFDRYGKLVKQLDPLSTGWDGTYRGAALPSGDYWFYVLLEDGREFKSHFSLIR